MGSPLCGGRKADSKPCRNYCERGRSCCRWHGPEKTDKHIEGQIQEKQDELADMPEESEEVGREGGLDGQLEVRRVRKDSAPASYDEGPAREAEQRDDTTSSSRSSSNQLNTQRGRSRSTQHRIEIAGDEVSGESRKLQPSSVHLGYRKTRLESTSPNQENKKRIRKGNLRSPLQVVDMPTVEQGADKDPQHWVQQPDSELQLEELLAQRVHEELQRRDLEYSQNLEAYTKKLTDVHNNELMQLKNELKIEREKFEGLDSRYLEERNANWEEFRRQRSEYEGECQAKLEAGLRRQELVHEKKVKDLNAKWEGFLNEKVAHIEQKHHDALKTERATLNAIHRRELQSQEERLEGEQKHKRFWELEEARSKHDQQCLEQVKQESRWKEKLVESKQDIAEVQAKYDALAAQAGQLDEVKKNATQAKEQLENASIRLIDTEEKAIKAQAELNSTSLKLKETQAELNGVLLKLKETQAELDDACLRLKDAKRDVAKAKADSRETVVATRDWWHSVRDYAIKLLQTLSEQDAEKRQRGLLVLLEEKATLGRQDRENASYADAKAEDTRARE